MTCPTCGSTDLRKSKSANARLAFPLFLIAVWIRCHNCGRRFLRFGVLPGKKIPGPLHRSRRAA